VRVWEIDFLRGLAVVMMIIFHFFYDLNYFSIAKFELYSGYALIYVYSIGMLFFLLVGVSLTLSYSKRKNLFWELKRGLKIFGIGLLITLVTWIYPREGFILFGALHSIGIGIILGSYFLRFRYLNLIVGTIFILIGIILKNLTFDFNWLLWAGFKPSGFYTLDYFPLFPWFGVILLGIFIGKGLENKTPGLLSKNMLINSLCFLGRHSLIIYLVHQPILLLLLYPLILK
jgi:uncharacterized membrane protein